MLVVVVTTTPPEQRLRRFCEQSAVQHSSYTTNKIHGGAGARSFPVTVVSCGRAIRDRRYFFKSGLRFVIFDVFSFWMMSQGVHLERSSSRSPAGLRGSLLNDA